MIIEGKHSELGQGIFISDIQDGSNADKVSAFQMVYRLWLEDGLRLTFIHRLDY